MHSVSDAGLPLIGQPQVANVIGQTGAGTTVVVLDTGVDYTHAEFGSCTAPGVPASCSVVYAADIAPDDGALDSIGHGSEVAAVVMAVAPGTKIAALDVFDDSGSASGSDVIAGINWAIANRTSYNIVAINMSLGDSSSHTTTCSTKTTNPFRQPIIDARSAGILSVVASGNDGHTNGLSSPACTPEAISVGATYNANYSGVSYSACTDSPATVDQVTCFSNSASYLTLVAPGALISVLGNSVAGTSFSTPYTSGAVAVLAGAFPSDTASGRQSRITNAGTVITDTRNGLNFKRLNLLAAMGAPANDNFAAARTLSGSSGSDNDWNYNATKESGEPAHAGNAGGRSIWWAWTAPATGLLQLSTAGSDFDTLLGLYTGSSINALTTVASNDNANDIATSSLGVHVQQGTPYRIAVDGKNAASGKIVLSWNLTADIADLGITLTGTPASVIVGGNLVYILTISNAGPNTANGVVGTLNLPSSGETFVSADSACSLNNLVVTCTAASLASGQNIQFSVTVQVTSTGTLNATASTSDGTTDPVSSNNGASLSLVANANSENSDLSGDIPVLPGWGMVLLAASLLGIVRAKQG